jgi:hypothetical protein
MEENNLKQKVSNTPWCIRIRNLTDEKLYDVKVFDFEHEKQRKIEYSSSTYNISYNELLRRIASYGVKMFDVVLLNHFVICDYAKFQLKQLCCGIDSTIKDTNGFEIRHKNYFMIDPYQQQTSVCNLETKFPLSVESNLHYEYLMPETEIKLFLYPEVIDGEGKDK